MVRARIASERQEQEALFDWAKANSRRHPCLRLGFAIPNGAQLAGDAKGRARRWKALEKQGAKTGVSDTFWPFQRRGYAGLWIEMKRRKAPQSAVTADQRSWLDAMAWEWYAVAVCRGWDEARDVLEWYVGESQQCPACVQLMPRNGRL